MTVRPPLSQGYRRMGRAPRRVLAANRRRTEPTLLALSHVGPIVDEDGNKIGERPLEQPQLRRDRQLFRSVEHRPESKKRRRQRIKREVWAARAIGASNVIVDRGQSRGIEIGEAFAGSNRIVGNRIINTGRTGRAG